MDACYSILQRTWKPNFANFADVGNECISRIYYRLNKCLCAVYLLLSLLELSALSSTVLDINTFLSFKKSIELISKNFRNLFTYIDGST